MLTLKTFLNHFSVFFFLLPIFSLYFNVCMTRIVFPPHPVLSDKNRHMNWHYCPYCRVNMYIYHLPPITHVPRLRWCFVCNKCLVLLLPWVEEVKWLWPFNQQLVVPGWKRSLLSLRSAPCNQKWINRGRLCDTMAFSHTLLILKNVWLIKKKLHLQEILT